MADDQPGSQYIDLHSHTTESDGSFSPEALVDLAVRSGLTALGITDHDTFSGFEKARPFAEAAGLTLVRGIELNSRLNLLDSSDYRAAHMLGYFPIQEPSSEFHRWLQSERDERKERNRKLAGALQQQGVAITLEEVEARGKTMTGRTHFAQILLEKGYVSSFDEAFYQYLGRGATTYVERESATTEQIICRIREAGGMPSVAHPVRLHLSREAERREIKRLADAGLVALEVIHSDQTPEMQLYYKQLANEFHLLPTGGSDFHGQIKPAIALGHGTEGNVRVPLAFLTGLREATLTAAC